MKLNRTGSNWNRLERNKINENWDIIEGSYNDVVGQITDEVVGHLIDSAKLIWKEPVDTVEDLPANAEVGETRMVREADPDGISYVYRYDGEKWEKIQAIDVTLVNEVDRRLSRQLAETDKQRAYESIINRKPIDKDKPTLLVSWTDDDGFVEVYDRFKSILQEYNIPITSGLITSKIGTDDSKYLNENQIKELAELGMEFVSHSHWHDVDNQLKDMSEEEVDYDLQTSQKIIKNMGYNHRGIILPFANNSNTIQKILRKYYDYAIGTGANQGQGKPFYPGQYSNYYIRRVRTEFGFDFVKQRIDEAKASGRAWVVLSSHIYEPIYTQTFIRQIIDYALQEGFEFVTTLEGINRMGNIAQFGEPLRGGYDTLDYVDAGTRVAADGSIHGAQLGNVVRYGDREVANDTLPNFFPNNTISVTKIRSLESNGFPNNSSGRLETYKFDEDTHVFQIYYTSDVTRKYNRYWDILNNKWSDWSIVELSEYLGLNAFKPNDPPHTNRFRPRVAYTVINASGSDGFPENKTGTLITYDFTYGDDHPFQEFHIKNSSRVYKRYWFGNGWSPWRKVQDRVGAIYRPINTVGASMQPHEFDEGITITYITSVGDNADLPENKKSGNLITYNEEGVGRAYQEFREGASSAKYFRHEKNDGTWSGWYKYSMDYIG